LPVDEISTVVKIPLTYRELANVLKEKEFQIETPTSGVVENLSHLDTVKN